ncbi:Proton-dependent oligopeptide transporter family [Parasponia andersonii]|uniref:Proton-dependent oligopeptide transporter family n=1 Tax=Parasponia andersonii TaxID=3476 RepID=A0A2P5B463_PARAD|nr:Proton-dependent oligopeptide transporter family [Parasponia andersonii]
MFAVVFVTLLGSVALPYIKPWSIRFGILTICRAVTTIIFLSSLCSYTWLIPQGSPLNYSINPHKTPIGCMRDVNSSPKDLFNFNCLNKDAIIIPSQSLEQHEKNRWRLCRVTKVKETKSMISMIPIGMTFVMLRVISSIGNTYFLE